VGARPGAPAPLFACLTLLGYSKPDPGTPGRPGRRVSQPPMVWEGAAPPLDLPCCCSLCCGVRRGMEPLRVLGDVIFALPDLDTELPPRYGKEPQPSFSPHASVRAATALPPAAVLARRGCVFVSIRDGPEGLLVTPRWSRRADLPSPLPSTYAKWLLWGGSARPLAVHTFLCLSPTWELTLRTLSPRPVVE
jgi:hypothetical protein